MNCLEFRRLKLAEPSVLTPQAREHLQTCSQCAEFARAQDAFEQQLASASRVEVDPSLASRVLLRRQLNDSATPRRAWFARAALVVLTLGLLASAALYTFGPAARLMEASAAHVAGEPSAMRADEKRSNEELATALARSGATLARPLDANISYIHNCPVPGGMGKHIVLRTKEGTITLLTMPNQKILMRRTLVKDGYVIALLPCKHGVVALVARSRVELAALEARLKQHVQWNA